ncbi:MAG: SDR family NAD(P)-dependent oxidoreductase, partial [Mycobacterium sp.]|nr:SDR family NAD(P)-dependent oxidoreductase [Mycobacterium sp.]
MALDQFNLHDQVAIVTGAGKGVGQGIARVLAEAGAAVVGTARTESDIVATIAGIEEAGGRGLAVVADAMSRSDGEHVVNTAMERYGRIDILINNAALFTAAPIVEIRREDYDRVFEINVAGTLFTLQAAAKRMIAQGSGGKIINMASQAGRRGEPLVLVYCSTKAAVISLTQSAGLNLIPHGINVNAIAPGVVDGEHWDGVDAFFARYEGKAPGQKKREVGAAVPYGRMGTAADLEGMAV